MPSKFQLAEYLFHLHTLIDAQKATGGLNPSSILADEYNCCWDQLKDAITKESNDETRKS